MSEAAAALGDVDVAILRFERQWWRHAGAKEVQIRDQLGLEPTRYYQRLNVLIDHSAAQAADPVLCSRLQRIRERRQGMFRAGTRTASDRGTRP
ncbi:DUF3263 domain-containing protein [Blastococcus sp. CT_GayMR16]|uniref:DUF3263 domain-containing protein n=1 Tax=Blastococcus sp. CT_GayMR16 TaxID=2559607 RepID=UPI001072F9EE|nr:DUF3263 domain-containing protein [Blastococcus sp. CT_GayMR16]TFV83140.1 DUF3263 domain-containing protein [Blastococcus sp. CT_GayMR16]